MLRKEKVKIDQQQQFVMSLHISAFVNNVLNGIMLYVLLFRCPEKKISWFSKVIMAFMFISKCFDHTVVASGTYFGDGYTLKKLSKIRCGFHGLAMPLLFIPVTEVWTRSNSVTSRKGNLISLVATAFAFRKAFFWYNYDIQRLILVDRRDYTSHSGFCFAGSLSYVSGQGLMMAVPAILLVVFSSVVGLHLIYNDIHVAGWWILNSSLITFVTTFLQDPFAQVMGETILLAGILKTLMVL